MTGKHIYPAARVPPVLLFEPLLIQHRHKFPHKWCAGCKHTTWFSFVWKMSLNNWFETVSITGGDLRNHMWKYSPLLLQSQLALGQCFNWDLIQVGSGSSKITQFPNRYQHDSSSFVHAKHHLPQRQRFPVNDGCQDGEWGRKKRKEKEERLVEAKETSSSSVEKLVSAKYFPTQNKIINRNKLNFTVGVFQWKDRALLPKITHSVHVFVCVSKLKRPWFKVHSAVRGRAMERGGKGVAWGQHVGWCSM